MQSSFLKPPKIYAFIPFDSLLNLHRAGRRAPCRIALQGVPAALITSLLFNLIVASPACAQGIVSTIGHIYKATLPKRASGPGVRNGLPPTTMDSFVYEAKEHAEIIYGDEGIDGPPPYELFTVASRINTGILDRRDQGLTSGHGSWMPDAAGRDEFLGMPEWSQSGTQGVSWKDGFYNGVPYKLPAAAYNPQQFPGGYNTLDWLYMIDEVRPRSEPLPISWNNGTAVNPVYGTTWSPLGNGNWINNKGDIVYPDGSILYGSNNPIYPAGTYVPRGS